MSKGFGEMFCGIDNQKKKKKKVEIPDQIILLSKQVLRANI